MRLVVIGSPGAWHVARIRAVAESRGHEVAVVEWRQLGAFVVPAPAGAEHETSIRTPFRTECFFPEAIDAADAVIVRGMPAGGGDPADGPPRPACRAWHAGDQ